MSKLKQNYQKAVTLLVELASLQTSFITLDEVLLHSLALPIKVNSLSIKTKKDKAG